MSNVKELIQGALRMFGPLTLPELQRRLDMVDQVLSQNEIEKLANELVADGLIKLATGFDDKAYKI